MKIKRVDDIVYGDFIDILNGRYAVNSVLYSCRDSVSLYLHGNTRDIIVHLPSSLKIAVFNENDNEDWL
jgi:hypothetical protein